MGRAVAVAALIVAAVSGWLLAAAPVSSAKPQRSLPQRSSLFIGYGTYCAIPDSEAKPKPKWRCSDIRGSFSFDLNADRRRISKFVGRFDQSACGRRSPSVGYGYIDVARNGAFSTLAKDSGASAYMFVTSGRKRSEPPIRFLARGRLTGPSSVTVTYEFVVPRATLSNPLVGLCLARVSGVAHPQ